MDAYRRFAGLDANREPLRADRHRATGHEFFEAAFEQIGVGAEVPAEIAASENAQQRAVAIRRLREYGFHIDAYLERMSPPGI